MKKDHSKKEKNAKVKEDKPLAMTEAAVPRYLSGADCYQQSKLYRNLEQKKTTPTEAEHYRILAEEYEQAARERGHPIEEITLSQQAMKGQSSPVLETPATHLEKVTKMHLSKQRFAFGFLFFSSLTGLAALLFYGMGITGNTIAPITTTDSLWAGTALLCISVILGVGYYSRKKYFYNALTRHRFRI